jgi:putative ABC transport system permease protein
MRTLATLGWDIRLAVRSLQRGAGFAVGAMLTLALGIGTTTAVFSVVYQTLLRPLPYADPGRLVVVWPQQSFNKTLLRDIAASLPSLQSISGFAVWPMSLVGDGVPPEEISVAEVSPNHFDLLGVPPSVGRGFRSEEGYRGAAGVVVLSHAFWVRRYGGDPAVIGRTIRLAGAGYQARRVIGVMPPRFRPVAGDVAAWVPLEELTAGADPTWYLGDVARLAPGATPERALAELRALGERLRPTAPQVFSKENLLQATVAPLAQVRVGTSASILWMLLASVAVVLVIACVNVANLLLARGERRAQEYALRRALGARRGRIVRQVLLEACLLGLGGCAAGIVVAQALLAVILALVPAGFIDTAPIAIDRTVLAFALGVSLLSALGFGVVPALLGSHGADGEVLRHSRGQLGARSTSRVSRALIAAELALAVPLLIGSSLLLRTLGNLFAVSPGFQTERVLVLRPNPPLSRVSGPPQFTAFYEETLRRIRALPEVRSAAATLMLPVTSSAWGFPTVIDDVPGSSVTPPSIDYVPVTPSYFETLGIPLLAGRTLAESDRPATPRVAVINQTMARRFWPGGNPIGRTLRSFSRTGTPFTIVGVVGDVHLQGLNTEPRPAMYVPDQQLGWGRQTGSAETALWVVVRTREADPLRVAPAIRDAVWSVDAETTITGMEAFGAVVARSAASTSFLTALLSGFGLLAVLLSLIGVYGVTAYAAARRIPEFGLRLALGASPAQLLRAALAGSGLALLIGLVVGSLVAALSSRLLQGMLFEVSRHDIASFLAVPLLLAAAAVLAAVLPARRATRVDPVVALRVD